MPVSFMRRLGVIFYDLLLVLSFIFIVALITHLLFLKLAGIEEIEPESSLSYLMFTWYLILGFIFFAWFWLHGGQTLGMRAWQVKLVTLEHKEINFKQALLRYVTGLCLPVISQLWVIFDKNGMAIHDHLSKTRLILLAK